MAAPAIGQTVTVTVTGVVVKADFTRGPEYLVEVNQPTIAAPVKRQIWVQDSEQV